jgi:hypothetical protein
MERERVLSGEKNMRVMVRSRKPAERALEFAQVVYDNLTNKIDYHYLFDLKQSSYHEIGLMLLALAVTNEVDLKERVQNPSEQQLQEHLEFSSRERVENNLKQMRKHLFVHFVDFEAFEEFCIHRYETDQAQCFWKLSNDRFLVIDRNSSEKRGKFYSRHIHWGRESIFNPENDWVKWARQPRPDARTLDQEIMDKFPEALHPVVLEACFGGIAAGV